MIISINIGRQILVWGVFANLILSLIASVIYSGVIPWGVKFSILSSTVAVFLTYVLIDIYHSYIEKRLKSDAKLHVLQLWVTCLFSLLVYTSLFRSITIAT